MRLAIRGAYPSEWREIATRVKEQAGWRCIRCRHPHDPHGRRAMVITCEPDCRHAQMVGPHGEKYSDRARCLTVHHLDGDKGNSAWWNLLALCQVCHLQVQARVVPERPWLLEHSEWFKPYVAGFYAHHHAGQSISREAAERDLDRWLALGQPWRATA